MRSIHAQAENPAIDVWLKFAAEPDPDDGDDLATHEANTYRLEDGTYRIEWYLNAVGLVTGVHFDTLEEAHAWYEREGFSDFSS